MNEEHGEDDSERDTSTHVYQVARKYKWKGKDKEMEREIKR